MNLRSWLIGSLLLLVMLLIIGCAEEEMIPPTPIARYTPAVPDAIVQPDVVDEAVVDPATVEAVPAPEQTPSPAIVELSPAELGALQPGAVPVPGEQAVVKPDVIALDTIELAATEPNVISLDPIELDAPQREVIPLDAVTLADPQPAETPLAMTALTIIQPEVGRLTLTELEIIQPEDVQRPVIGVEAGADRAVLPLPSETMAITGTVVEALSLLRHPVVNVDGQRLGSLDDLVVNLADGHLLFATLTYGGLLNLNLGSRVLPIPHLALSWDAVNEQVRLGLSNTELRQMEGFGNRWPRLDSPEWGMDVLSAWQPMDRTLSNDETSILYAQTTPATVRLVSTLVGERVRNPMGNELARVDELLIDLDNGVITHLILRQGGFLGLGANQYAVPFPAFSVSALGDHERDATLILNATQDDFAEAPVYDREQINFQDPEWGAPFHAYWQRINVQPATTP